MYTRPSARLVPCLTTLNPKPSGLYLNPPFPTMESSVLQLHYLLASKQTMTHWEALKNNSSHDKKASNISNDNNNNGNEKIVTIKVPVEINTLSHLREKDIKSWKLPGRAQILSQLLPTPRTLLRKHYAGAPSPEHLGST